MSEDVERQSATIYQFPRRGRFAPSASDAGAGAASKSRPVKSVVGGAWYHDEAIANERKE